MQLNTRKPTIRHKPRSIDKLPRDGIDIRLCHLPRSRKRKLPHETLKPPIPNVHLDGTRGNSRYKDTPASSNTERLSTRMTQLDNGRRAVLLACFSVFAPGFYHGCVVLFALVFGGQGWIKWGSQVVYVDLYIS